MPAPAANLQAVTPQLVAAAGRTIGGWGRASGTAMGAPGRVTVGPGYDPAGRLVEKRVGDYVWSFGYDTEGRLKTATQDWQPVSWEAAETSTEVAYGYDAFGRRVRLEQTDWAARIEAGGSWTQSRTADLTYRFVYDGPNVVAEYVDEDGDTVVDRKRIYWNEPSIDQKIGFVDLDGDGNATVYYYVTDQVGSVLQVLDATGKLVEQYAYDAFGNLREGKCTLKSGFDNRYRFHGRERDPFTGQYYYRYRQYDPDLGRFTNPDHQVDLADRFGPCNYAFCQNNPLVYADPMGLDAREKARVINALVRMGYDRLKVVELLELFPEVLPDVFLQAGRSALTLTEATRDPNAFPCAPDELSSRYDRPDLVYYPVIDSEPGGPTPTNSEREFRRVRFALAMAHPELANLFSLHAQDRIRQNAVCYDEHREALEVHLSRVASATADPSGGESTTEDLVPKNIQVRDSRRNQPSAPVSQKPSVPRVGPKTVAQEAAAGQTRRAASSSIGAESKGLDNVCDASIKGYSTDGQPYWDGSDIPVGTLVTPVYDSQGNLIGYGIPGNEKGIIRGSALTGMDLK